MYWFCGCSSTLPWALTRKAWPLPLKFSELISRVMLSRSMSAPATPTKRPSTRTGVAMVITSLPDEAAMYGSVRMVPWAALAALYQPRWRGS